MRSGGAPRSPGLGAAEGLGGRPAGGGAPLPRRGVSAFQPWATREVNSARTASCCGGGRWGEWPRKIPPRVFLLWSLPAGSCRPHRRHRCLPTLRTGGAAEGGCTGQGGSGRLPAPTSGPAGLAPCGALRGAPLPPACTHPPAASEDGSGGCDSCPPSVRPSLPLRPAPRQKVSAPPQVINLPFG